MNTISYKELKDWYINNDEAKAAAKKYFGKQQPNVYRTGFYSAPSWNWGYIIGVVGVRENKYTPDTTYFEVVTQFGSVVAARMINLPVTIMEAENE